MKLSQKTSRSTAAGISSRLATEYMNNESGLSDFRHSISLRFFKRLIDIFVSVFFFVAFGWLYLILWGGVLLTSGSPGIYSQPRYGRDGRVFKFFKFRSMVTDSAEVLDIYLKSNPAAKLQWEKYQKLENDPRITRFGAFIRKTSLDELPQFWNVFIGDMSLIGPRPCMLSQKELYGSAWAYYSAVRPGITGLWQVSGRNSLSYSERVVLDVGYVKNLSIFNDISIFFKTIGVVLTGHGSR